MTLPPQIGRYRVLGLLGRGAMGVVYRGRDEGLDRDVALKVMAPGGDASPESHARFLREARSAARLQHPNIVTIYELGEHQGAPFMAMELLEGVDLQRAIAGGLRPDPQMTLPIVLQLLAGLAHAHDHGIVHRDVKPSNVFLPRGRPAKIMDFGVARLASGMTAAGVVVGTPNYMSPEQVSAGLVDGRSDLFSAGLILYELVTGEKAYRADNVVSLLYKIAHEPPALTDLPQGPRWERLRKVVSRSLAREPENRYPDARLMAEELGQALMDLGGSADGAAASDKGLLIRAAPPAPQAEAPATAAAALPPSPAEPSRRRVAATIAIAAAALLAGFGVYALIRPAPPSGPDAAPGAAPAQTPRPAMPSAPPSLVAIPPPSAVLPAPEPAAPGVAPTPLTAAASPRLPAPPRPASAHEAGAPEPRPGADATRLEKASDLFERGRYGAALAEARTVLQRNPGNAEARTLVEDAEAAIVVEGRIRKAREALRKGDRERALEEARAGLAVAPSDARLLALFREATQ